MASLHSLGISPGDSLMLMEYTEVGWFIKEIGRQKQNEDIKKYLTIAEATRVGTIGASSTKGEKAYHKWVKSLENKLEESDLVLDRMTVFKRIKEKMKFEKLTVFERLKRARG